ncbi:MAG: MBL fold metallo-hydrolase [Candidatus Latescibacterota bacterium]|nr:MBL fold metallo-hydrolase [Candidatus Latescibacterota bacterium]
MTEPWHPLDEGLHVLRDSCLVYALRGPEGTVVINAGTGTAADYLDEVAGNTSVTVLLTHHFRDHSDGALRLAAKGAKVVAPYWDQEYFLDPEQHFRERQIWNSYDNRWDRHSPVRPIPVDDWAMDYETRQIAGLTWKVVPTPGVTNGACSYVVDTDAGRWAFVGEVICGHGRTGRLAPLQYNYNDLTGLTNLCHSSRRLLNELPVRLFPSLGETIDDPAAGVGTFIENAREVERIHPGFTIPDPEADDMVEVSEHLLYSRYGGAQTHFVVSDSGKVLSLDYGYSGIDYVGPGKHHLSNRRPFLHGLNGLAKRGIEPRVDTVLLTHFHDDHVNGIPLLQRLFDTQVWAAREFSDVLERPERYDRPCLWHEPISVARHLPTGETFEWEGIPVTLYPMSGHTRFATLVCMEVDGKRIAHTGDQIFYSDGGWKPGSRMFTNHVYKNGLDIGCYLKVVEDLDRFQPDLVITGHTLPFEVDEEWHAEIRRGAQAFDDVHRQLMILGDDENHFGAESQAAKLKPYRLHLPYGGREELEGWVLNPLPRKATARLRLVLPNGWQADEAEIELEAREKKSFELTLEVPAAVKCRRQPIALDLSVDGQPFGQVTEALVTAGVERF